MLLPREQLISYIQNSTEEQRVLFSLANQCAPVITGLKPANLLMIDPDLYDIYHDCLSRWKLDMKALYEDNRRIALLIYQKSMLEENLSVKNHVSFLNQCGYWNLALEQSMTLLGQRIGFYYEEGSEYPHECGIFLGIPLHDVKGFILHSGQNFLFSGYWKVYEAADTARIMFQQYDESRKMLISKLMLGNLN